MIKPKLKQCDGPCGEMRVIWKNHEGNKYCKQCWSCHEDNKPDYKPTARQKHIAPRSPKRSKLERAYAAKRITFLTEHTMCEARLPCCTNNATDVHHKQGRIGMLLLDVTKWLAVCRACHDWIERHPAEAQERGFSLKRINYEHNPKKADED